MGVCGLRWVRLTGGDKRQDKRQAGAATGCGPSGVVGGEGIERAASRATSWQLAPRARALRRPNGAAWRGAGPRGKRPPGPGGRGLFRRTRATATEEPSKRLRRAGVLRAPGPSCVASLEGSSGRCARWGGDWGGSGKVGSSPQPPPRRASPGLTCVDRRLGRLGRRGRCPSGTPGEAGFPGVDVPPSPSRAATRRVVPVASPFNPS